MFRNYFKTGIRNLQRYKIFSILNILGLGLGIGCALLIFLLVSFQMSFDTFHKNADQIYRTASILHFDEVMKTPGVPNPLLGAIRMEMPEVKTVSATFSYQQAAIVVEENGEKKAFQSEENAFMVEPSYFDMFDVEFIAGSAAVLDAPYKAILTEKSAKNFFGDKNPLGRSFRFNDKFDIIVEGLIKDVPKNSDFMGGIYISFATRVKEIEPKELDDWTSVTSSFQIFMLIPPSLSAVQVNQNIREFTKKYLKKDWEKYELVLTPLRSLHFDTDLGDQVPFELIAAVGLVGIFLLFTACINFINLATAQALNRSKEVGIRKVLGGTKSQLFRQFMVETFIIVVLSLLVGLAFASICLPKMNSLTELSLSMNLLNNPTLILFLVGILFFVTLFAGAYPAFILSGFQPSKAIKGSITSRTVGKFNLRRSLVIAQFMICQVLIIGLIVIHNQMEFVRQKDLGFKTEGVVCIPLPENSKEKIQSFGYELRTIKGVHSLSFNHDAPSSHSQNSSNHSLESGESEKWQIRTKCGDENYLKTFGLSLVAGRDFVATDTINQYILNESAVRKYGFKNPEEIIGKQFTIWGTKAPIVGVVKDFNTTKLSEAIQPLVLVPERNVYHSAAMVIDLDNTQNILTEIEKTYHTAFPGIFYQHEFLDETIAKFYQLENILLQLVRFFCGIAIFIACLGLYGLVSFMALHKKKEIGVRKVLGASLSDILGIFGKEFFTLLLVGFVLAAPLAYFLMQTWLSDYAYRISLSFDIFLSSLLATLVLTLITVGWQSYTAATSLPSESLRSE